MAPPDYTVEKTYQLAPYLGAFGSYLMPQWLIYGSKCVSMYQNDRWNVAVNSRYLQSGQKNIILVKNDPPPNFCCLKFFLLFFMSQMNKQNW